MPNLEDQGVHLCFLRDSTSQPGDRMVRVRMGEAKEAERRNPGGSGEKIPQNESPHQEAAKEKGI